MGRKIGQNRKKTLSLTPQLGNHPARQPASVHEIVFFLFWPIFPPTPKFFSCFCIVIYRFFPFFHFFPVFSWFGSGPSWPSSQPSTPASHDPVSHDGSKGGRTCGRMDGRTDMRTDAPTYVLRLVLHQIQAIVCSSGLRNVRDPPIPSNIVSQAVCV